MCRSTNFNAKPKTQYYFIVYVMQIESRCTRKCSRTRKSVCERQSTESMLLNLDVLAFLSDDCVRDDVPLNWICNARFAQIANWQNESFCSISNRMNGKTENVTENEETKILFRRWNRNWSWRKTRIGFWVALMNRLKMTNLFSVHQNQYIFDFYLCSST